MKRSNTITHPYGETIQHRVTIESTLGAVTFDTDDVVYWVVRDARGKLVWWHTYEPEIVDDTWVFDWIISHDEAERLLKPGRYKWGFSIYRDAVLSEGRPINGTVIIPVTDGDLIIEQAVSREGP